MVLNKHKSADRDEFLPKVLRGFANVNTAHFRNFCIITENRDVENLKVEKMSTPREEMDVLEKHKTRDLGADS